MSRQRKGRRSWSITSSKRPSSVPAAPPRRGTFPARNCSQLRHVPMQLTHRLLNDRNERFPLTQMKKHADHLGLCSHSLENKEQGRQSTFRNAFSFCQTRILSRVSRTSLRTPNVRERGAPGAFSFFEKNHALASHTGLPQVCPPPKSPSSLHTPAQTR